MPDTAPIAPPSSRWPRRAWFGGMLAVLVLAGVLYGLVTPGKDGSGACTASASTAARLAPLAHGELAALSVAGTPAPMPDIAFKAEGEAPKTLADFKGKAVLFNLWATWCVPCRKEMPALDALQTSLGGTDFQVVAVNVDTARLDRPRKFLAEVAATHLPFYADPTGAVLGTAKENGPVLGLPTTFLIDKNGCVVATMAGPADWGSAEAMRVVKEMKG